jgi:rRNA-processing protein FCF1
MKVVFDSSFLVHAAKNRRAFGDLRELVEGKLEFMVPSGVEIEMTKLGFGKEFEAMKKEFGIKVVEEGIGNSTNVGRGLSPVDSSVLSLAVFEKAIMCTLDYALRSECRKNGLKTVFLRKNKVLTSD